MKKARTKQFANTRVVMDSELKKKTQEMAARRGITVSAFMRSLLEEFVNSKMTRKEMLEMLRPYR